MPRSPCVACDTSRPSREEEEEDEEMEEDEEQGGGEDGGHCELWLGTADWELWEGIWAELELLLCMQPMPFSVRNSSKSMYCSWKRPPSQGRVRSHNRGPRKADCEEGLRVQPLPPPAPPSESSSEARGFSLSGGANTY